MIHRGAGPIWTAPVFLESAAFLMELTVGQSAGGGGSALSALLTCRSVL